MVYLNFIFVIGRKKDCYFLTRRENVENIFSKKSGTRRSFQILFASLRMQLRMIRNDHPSRHCRSTDISNWIIRISAVVVRGVVSIVQWLLLRRSVTEKFQENFVSRVQVKSEWVIIKARARRK